MKKEAPEPGQEQEPQDTIKDVPLGTDNIVQFEDNPVKYDCEQLHTFVKTVFHTLDDDANVYVQLSKKAPRGFGRTPEKTFTHRLAKTEAPMPGYMSTASLALTDGDLRHTKAAFVAFHYLVLDDVGTKIPWEKIPEELAENVNIESSEKNHQLGYILKEPIRDYEEAQLLIDLFVDAGLTDGGGAMPCKKVRLPCGVNGKEGDKGLWRVKLHVLNNDYWSVQELLDAAKIDVNWETYRVQARDKTRRAKRIGSTAWNPDAFYFNPLTGVSDCVLDFLAGKGMVIQDSQEPFYDIICPFHDEHTESDLHSKLCGYSPLGHGKYTNTRIFHCFHDSCSKRTNADFLDEIYAMGGPEAPVREYAPESVVGLVYDRVNDKVYDTKAPVMTGTPVKNMARTLEKVRIGSRQVDPLALWLKQPACVIVDGPTFDPSSRDKIIDDNGTLRVNIATLPHYPVLRPNMDTVQVFLDYIDYLFPQEDEREYFLKWLACKVQNPAFRGAAIVLITQSQGTGKNTLMLMLGKLFGERNVEQMSMDNLLRPGQFNDWAQKLFVNINESLATSDGLAARRAYNKLKEIVDPMAMPVVINAKNVQRYEAKMCTSFLFFSNHYDAVYLQEGDRRFFAAAGPDEPESAEFFTRIHKWIASNTWQADVWNYFMNVEVDEGEMMKPALRTSTMDDIRHETMTNLDAIVKGIIACWPTPLVPGFIFNEVVPMYIGRGIPDKYDGVVRSHVRDWLLSIRKTGNDKVCGRRCRLKPHTIPVQDEPLRIARDETMPHVNNFDPVAFKAQVDAWILNQGLDF